jgi:hypothetical protein
MKGEKVVQALARTDSDSEENKDSRTSQTLHRLFGKLAAFITLCALSYDDEDGKVKQLALFGTNIAKCR